jgi:molybdopterin-guanine dinucleotide biosynthesis protein B
MKVVGFIGYSNTGKTTLIEKLIPIFVARGLTVSTVKNAHHGFDMDRPGKDSYRYRQAGSAQVLIATAERWALLTEVRQGPAPLEQHRAADLPARCERDRGGGRPRGRHGLAGARPERRR